ncbi:hypothetical protein MA16_Dca027592 [Dendrobium catenatum]|uniref:Reverse transcriptase zinc-binding domain-containing protein n=1 Tax=Dendrobium catenatum TaxID=906689 RepID=A0A2I0W7V8_9ASPA|nr:hypothetical protein MA16_Dca027592 [Dendrobium catenatum]
MARLGKLKTADNLLLRGIQVPLNCSLCSGMLENHSQFFFNCDFSLYILKTILPDFNYFLLRPTLPQTLDFIENSGKFNNAEKDFCFLALSCIIYHIWRERNNRRFSDLRNNVVKLICNISSALRLKTFKWKNRNSLLQRFTIM